MNKKPTLTVARDVLRHEADAILAAEKILDGNFEQAVELILNIEISGRVITSGLGKAGIIANKLSATLASTGQPSYYLHPTDAMHGDLGRFAAEDIVVILSKSGQTEEVVKLVPFVKRIGCKIIAITGVKDSPLAKHSDIVLHIGDVTEAGDHGLAPTASTTVMLALGDALALTLQDAKNLSKEDFVNHHPGGALGRALLTVSELMRSGEENCILQDGILVRQALKDITSTPGRPGAASIIDTDGKLVGIFTDGDLRRCLAEHDNFLSMRISEVMGKNPKTITGNKLAQEALKVMSEHKIDQVIVVDEAQKPVGIIDIQDITLTK